jgi:tRNA(His) 5'-end guanylyltransferase
MLPDIVREYFRIMEEAENESILAALQAIVLQYAESDEVCAMAPMMTQRLVALFEKYAGESK